MRKLLFLFLSTFVLAAFGQEKMNQFVISEDLNESWVVYDQEYKSFVPYRLNEHAGVRAHSLVIDKESNALYNLLISCSEENQFLFVDGSLVKQLNKDELVSLQISELGKKDKRWVYITIFGSSAISSKTAQMGFKKQTLEEFIPVSKKEVLTMERRNRDQLAGMTVFSSVFVLFLLAITSGAYPRAFTRFVDIFGVFDAKLREASMLINKPFSRVNMTFLLLLSFVTGFLCWCFYDLDADVLYSSFYLISGSELWVNVLNFLIFSVLSFGLYLAKLLYIRIVGSIFGLGKIVDLHYFKMIQVSLSTFLPFSLLLVGYIFSGYAGYFEPQALFYWCIFIFYLVRMLSIVFALNTNSQIQFHYLITYLCVVELLPLVLALRFVI